MSLSELRNSINSIKMLVKSTGAMRVISMSLHTILKKELLLFNDFFNKYSYLKDKISLIPKKNDKESILYVFIGSQRGLCGSYNNEMEKKIIEINNNKKENKNYFFIIGRQLSNKITKYLLDDFIVFLNFKKEFFSDLQKMIINHARSKNIDKIVIYYNSSKTLFNREILVDEIIMEYDFLKDNDIFYGHFNENYFSEFYIEKFNLYKLKLIFYKALISEQASRFIAMDAANKNANEQIRIKEITYNKTRQAIITKELLSLSGQKN
jgi:ATP synthase F1 gamma subunit